MIKKIWNNRCYITMVLAASLAGFEYGFNGKTDLFACFCAVCFFAMWIGLMRKFRYEE